MSARKALDGEIEAWNGESQVKNIEALPCNAETEAWDTEKEA